MSIKSISNGIAVGLVTGTAVYALTNASNHKKKVLRSRTGRALHAMGDVIDGLSMMLK